MTMLLLAALLCLQDLDSSDPLVARRAMEAAIRKGDEKALEASAKTSRGARLALAELRAHKRFGDAYPRPISFTLQGRDMPALEAIDKLSAALGKPVVIDNGPDSLAKLKVTVDLRDATLMEAADVLGKALDRRIDASRYRVSVSTSAPTPIGPHVYWRHVRIILGSLGESRELLGAGENERTADLRFGIDPDGRCRIVGTRGLRIDEVIDDGGRTIVPVSVPLNGWFGDVGRFSGHGMAVGLNSAPDDGARRITVRGAWAFLLPEQPYFEELPVGDRSKTIEGLNLTIQAPEASENFSTMKVTGRIGDWHKPHVYPLPGDFQLVGKDGRKIDAKGHISGPVECAVLDLEFDLPEGFAAASLRIRLFRSVGDHEWPFEFKDLPLR